VFNIFEIVILTTAKAKLISRNTFDTLLYDYIAQYSTNCHLIHETSHTKLELNFYGECNEILSQ